MKSILTSKDRCLPKLTLIQYLLYLTITSRSGRSPQLHHHARQAITTTSYDSTQEALIVGRRGICSPLCTAPGPSLLHFVHSGKLHGSICFWIPGGPIVPAKDKRRNSRACLPITTAYPQNQPTQSPPEQATLTDKSSSPSGTIPPHPEWLQTHKAAPPQTHTSTCSQT